MIDMDGIPDIDDAAAVHYNHIADNYRALFVRWDVKMKPDVTNRDILRVWIGASSMNQEDINEWMIDLFGDAT